MNCQDAVVAADVVGGVDFVAVGSEVARPLQCGRVLVE